MRLLSGNPGMYQHSVEHSTEGETTHLEPEHGEDTIARVKGTDSLLPLYLGLKNICLIYECVCIYRCVCVCVLTFMNIAFPTTPAIFACFVLLRAGEGSSEEIPVHSRWGRWRQSGSASGAAAGVRRAWGGAEDWQHIPAAPPGGGREGQTATQIHQTEQLRK